DPDMRDVPGGTTGLLVRTVKWVGSFVFYLYQVDTRLLKQLLKHEKQAAQELGQWGQKTEGIGKDCRPSPVTILAAKDRPSNDDSPKQAWMSGLKLLKISPNPARPSRSLMPPFSWRKKNLRIRRSPNS